MDDVYAVLDVYEKEPLAPDHPLRTTKNVLLMPHMGASTYEAQRNVSCDVAEAVASPGVHAVLLAVLLVVGRSGPEGWLSRG